MSFRNYLRSKTRQPPFLWKVGLGIIGVGAVLAIVLQGAWAPDVAALLNDLGQLDKQLVPLDEWAAAGNWSEVWWNIPKAMWQGVRPGPTTLALLAGGCWFAIAIQAGQPGSSGGVRWWLALVAVLLGVVSIWPTLFALYYQEAVWQLSDANDLIGGLRYCLLGVGLREELAKLLLFLPLVPFVVRRGSEREALIVAACVGLGFAMEENISYFRGAAGSAVPRLLTANFFHMALTGLSGLAICRAIWNPRECAAEAAAYVVLAILLHGMYDVVIMVQVLNDYSLAGMIIFVLLTYQFFHELRQWWKPPGGVVSLAATFVAAVSLVFAATLVYQSAISDFETSLDLVAQPAVAMGVMLIVFLREMPESLA